MGLPISVANFSDVADFDKILERLIEIGVSSSAVRDTGAKTITWTVTTTTYVYTIVKRYADVALTQHVGTDAITRVAV